MYSYDDIKEIENRLKKFLIYFVLATVTFIALLVVVCKNWGTVLDPVRIPVWPAYVAGIVYAVYAVFSWSLIGVKLVKYRKFVYEILTGLDRNINGKIVKISKETTYDNDLEFYSIEVKEDNSDGNRLLHLDAVKDIEILEIDKNVRFKIFGNYIKDILS